MVSLKGMMPKATSQRDVVLLPNGSVLAVHPASRCVGRYCSVHNPSDHPLSRHRQHWRFDRGLMERICDHGIGHPDPDDIAFKRAVCGEEFAIYEAIHGCDGCCQPEPPIIDIEEVPPALAAAPEPRWVSDADRWALPGAN